MSPEIKVKITVTIPMKVLSMAPTEHRTHRKRSCSVAGCHLLPHRLSLAGGSKSRYSSPTSRREERNQRTQDHKIYFFFHNHPSSSPFYSATKPPLRATRRRPRACLLSRGFAFSPHRSARSMNHPHFFYPPACTARKRPSG